MFDIIKRLDCYDWEWGFGRRSNNDVYSSQQTNILLEDIITDRPTPVIT